MNIYSVNLTVKVEGGDLVKRCLGIFDNDYTEAENFRDLVFKELEAVLESDKEYFTTKTTKYQLELWHKCYISYVKVEVVVGDYSVNY